MRRVAVLLGALCVACPPAPGPPPPLPTQAATAAPSPDAPTPHEGLSAAELLALPEDREYHAWDVDPEEAPPTASATAQPTAVYSHLEIPRDEHGAAWWPMVPPSTGLDAMRFAEAHHTQVRWADRPFYVPVNTKSWTGERPTDAQLDRWLPAVREALSQYPAQVLERMHVDHVVLMRQLKFRRQHRNGTMVGRTGTMLLNTDTFARATQREIARAVHHEVFHALDYADGDLWNDPAWDALNRPDFRYGGGGRTMQELKGAGAWDPDRAGFLTQYATSGNEEDKAEMFSWMMVELQKVEARAGRDPVLQAKFDRIKELCLAFDDDLDDGFWSIRRIQSRGATNRP